MHIYMILHFTLAFTILGIYAAVFLSIGSILESTQLIFCFIYNAYSTTAFCVIGQHLKDSVCATYVVYCKFFVLSRFEIVCRLKRSELEYISVIGTVPQSPFGRRCLMC